MFPRVCLLLGVFLLMFVAGDEDAHRYKNFEPIILWANKISPFNNPQETYEYFSLPFCLPAEPVGRTESLGEALSGFELRSTAMKIQFKEDVEKTKLCSVLLDEAKTAQLQRAVVQQYWFEFFFDDLPIWGWVGESVKGINYVYRHYAITVAYNGDQVISIKLDETRPAPLVAGSTIEFSYSVKWELTDEEFEARFDRYLEDKFFEHQVHWFSIFNSAMMVVFLVAVVSMILMRTLKRDFQSRDDEDPEDEAAWKKVHGDVFRYPGRLGLLSALLGAGAQLFVLVLLCIILTIFFYHDHPFYRRGTIVSIFLGLYAVTSVIAGFVSGGYYKRHGGKDFVSIMILTGAIFPSVIFTGAFLLNLIALSYSSLAHIPFGTMIIVFLIWLLVALPLTLIGTYVGRHYGDKNKGPPCRVTPFPKPIPTKRLYQQIWVYGLSGGLLPFSSIFIEMYFVFTAFWQSKFYYVFGFLLVVYLILTVVVICTTIVSTYFLLNTEDYRWQWSSFLSSASITVYMFLYSIYYFMAKTKMSGTLQVSFYFGYMLMFCFGVGLITGTIGFFASQTFVHKIYTAVHSD